MSLWFDKLTMIGPDPFALSLSKGKFSTNGYAYSTGSDPKKSGRNVHKKGRAISDSASGFV